MRALEILVILPGGGAPHRFGPRSTVLIKDHFIELAAGAGPAVERCPGLGVPLDASGDVALDTVRTIDETGVNVISIGALTHSVRNLDLGRDTDD